MQTGAVIDDRFEIERLAGSGGMGTVYRALDRARATPVAVKILGSVAAADRARFEREARILAEFRHPGVVRYVAHGETDAGRRYLVMEWLEGEDLDERLSRGSLGVREAVGLVRRAADALAAAHRIGVIHRDIKPSNLFLAGGSLERVKILDFGIARSGVGGATRTGMVIGTPGFIAPEQARGLRDIDARADVFALGSVLYACLTGRPPFAGGDLLSLLSRVLLEETPRVSEIWPDVPPALDEIVARFMSSDAVHRPLDAAAVARELDDLGELPDLRRGSVPPRSLGLGTAEQRLYCVILAGSEHDPEGRALDPDELPGDEGATRRMAEQETVAMEPTIATDALELPTPQLRDVVRRFRGRLEVLAGGARLVMLEGYGVATDQAARAARCALALREGLGASPMVLATGRGLGMHRTGAGDVLDRAARMLRIAAEQARALPGPPSVLLDDATLGLLGDRFAVERTPAGALLGPERDAPDAPRPLLGRPTPCVGRDREIGTLVALFDECVSEPVARSALLSGPAGSGKSRVRLELLARLRERGDAVEVWIGRGDAMTAGAPLDLLAQALRGAAGISIAEPIEARRAKIQRLASRSVEAASAPRVAWFLGEIVGAPFEAAESVELAAARADAALMADQCRRAVEDLFAAECAARPLVLVLEDLQWGDLPTVKLVDGLLRNLAERPLFVLGTARPEARELFPSLWEGRSFEEIRIGALTPKACERLVRHVLGGGASREVVERIVARAGGHALHLEEMVRAVARGGGDALPDTVVAMVQARLEALEPEARRLLRAASVFGCAFWAAGVGALLGEDASASETRDWLAELGEREWLVHRGASRFPGHDEYAFRQDVVREAAYGMLTPADRALGHRLAGAWLEAAAREGLAALAACGATEEGVTMLHLAHAEALAALGEREAARAAIAPLSA